VHTDHEAHPCRYPRGSAGGGQNRRADAGQGELHEHDDPESSADGAVADRGPPGAGAGGDHDSGHCNKDREDAAHGKRDDQP
jgi:hypothetical protein